MEQIQIFNAEKYGGRLPGRPIRFQFQEVWNLNQNSRDLQIGGENLDTVFQRAAGAIFNLQNLTCTDLKVRAMSMEGRADKV